MASIIRQIALYLTIALVLDRLVRLICFVGIHRTVYAHYPGSCKALPGIVNGSEDIVTASNGLAFISSGVRRIQDPKLDMEGKIFLFDFNQPDLAPKEVRIDGGGLRARDWIPLGMSIWETGPSDNPAISLYVINRQVGNVGIDVLDFLFDNDLPTLKHKRKIQHKNIWSPNGLVVVGENRFYTTNDKYLPQSIDFLEVLFSLRFGSVVYFDGREARIVADRIKMANGISLSRDKKMLYVAGAAGQAIHIFKTLDDGDVEPLKVIHLATVPDNIDVDRDDGSLWVGCHSSIYTVLLQGNGFGQVLNIQLDEDLEPTIREVFADDTGLIKGSSIASRYGRAMLIGTILEKAAYCELLAY